MDPCNLELNKTSQRKTLSASLFKYVTLRNHMEIFVTDSKRSLTSNPFSRTQKTRKRTYSLNETPPFCYIAPIMYLQSQGCLVVSIRHPLLDNPSKNRAVLEVGERSVDAGLGIGTWFRPNQRLRVGAILVTSNRSRGRSRGRPILLDIWDRNHPSLPFAIFCIPPLLFGLFPNSQDVTFLKRKVFSVVATEVKDSSHVFHFLLPQRRIAVVSGFGNRFYQGGSIQVMYFVELQQSWQGVKLLIAYSEPRRIQTWLVGQREKTTSY